MSQSGRKAVVISLDPKHQKQASKVIGKLEKKGFILSESLTGIGVLTGSVPSEALKDLSEVEGVENVEENRTDYRPQ